MNLKSLTTQSTVYRQEARELATGDRIQFTASNKEQGIRTRDFGTVSAIADNNALSVRLDNGKTVTLDPTKARHIEHGYAVDGLKPCTQSVSWSALRARDTSPEKTPSTKQCPASPKTPRSTYPTPALATQR